MSNVRTNANIVSRLLYRDIKVFLKDKANVFFSMLAPLIVLILYVLFLKRVQLDGMKEIFRGINLDESLMEAFLDGWLISGMLSIGCVTVSLSANTIAVKDKANGIMNDILVSPVKQYLVKISYYLFNFFVTVIIMTFVFIVGMIYLGATGSWHMSVGEFFALYGTLIFSALSATVITSFITSFCKTEATLSALVGIMSAMIGFIMGAYIPLDMMPEWMQYVAGLIPGTHSAGMMRELLMTGALNEIADVVNIPELTDALAEGYSMELNFFGTYIKSGYMSLYILGSTLVVAVINFFIKDNKPLGYTKSKKQ